MLGLALDYGSLVGDDRLDAEGCTMGMVADHCNGYNFIRSILIFLYLLSAKRVKLKQEIYPANFFFVV